MTATNFDRRIDLSMKNIVELGTYDLTVLLADRIYMKNSTEEENVRTGAVMKHRWARGHAEYRITSYAVQLQSIHNIIFNAPPLQTKLGFPNYEESTKFELRL